MTSNHSAASAALEPGGTIRVTWVDGTPSAVFSGRWLWFNAPPHVDAGTGQRSLSSAALCAAPSPRRARLSDDRLAVSVDWSDGTTFTFDAQWLRRHAFSDASLACEQAAATPPSLAPARAGGRIGASSLPTFSFDALMSSEDEVWRWLLALNNVGLTLVDGAPLEGGTATRIAERISAPMHTIYGAVFDVVVEARPINLAYAPVGLELHCDLVYYESPPGLQLLHCRRFDEGVAGGESTFMDGFLIAEELRKRRPAAFATLLRVPATFQKVHYARARPVHIVAQRPHITVDRSLLPSDAPATAGAITGVFWAPPFEGPLRARADDIEPYFDAHAAWDLTVAELEAEGHLVEFRMSPGTVSVFNNRRILHGRRPFSVDVPGEERVLQGCYVHADEFKSRLRTLCERFGGAERVRRIGNQQAL